MREYKQITKANHSQWRGWGYIKTYFALEEKWLNEDEYLKSLDNDKPLQRLVRLHHIKKNALIASFNIGVYILLYSLTLLIG